MDRVRKITNELAIAGQLTLEDLQQLVEEGYQSVVNLRSPDEAGFLNDEQQKTERLGLRYINTPIRVKDLNPEYILQITQQIAELPKPILVHCDSGMRSSVMALMQIAIEQGMKAEDAFQKAVQLGLLSSSF